MSKVETYITLGDLGDEQEVVITYSYFGGEEPSFDCEGEPEEWDITSIIHKDTGIELIGMLKPAAWDEIVEVIKGSY